MNKIEYLEGLNVNAIVILCSGEFPELIKTTTVKVPIIFPDLLLKNIVSTLNIRRLGIIVPLKEQVTYAMNKWDKYASQTVVVHVSPYTGRSEEFKEASEILRKSNVDLIVMDCIGYTLQHKLIVRRHTGVPVITPRSILGRVLAELYG